MGAKIRDFTLQKVPYILIVGDKEAEAGAIALRVAGNLVWDAEKMRFTNNDEANRYLKPTFRKGWSLT